MAYSDLIHLHRADGTRISAERWSITGIAENPMEPADSLLPTRGGCVITRRGVPGTTHVRESYDEVLAVCREPAEVKRAREEGRLIDALGAILTCGRFPLNDYDKDEVEFVFRGLYALNPEVMEIPLFAGTLLWEVLSTRRCENPLYLQVNLDLLAKLVELGR